MVPHSTTVHFSRPRCVVDIVCITPSYPTVIVFFVYSGPSLYRCSLFTASLCRRYCLCHSLSPHFNCLFVCSGPSLYRCSLFTASPCRRYCLCHPTLIVFLCAVVPHYTAVHFSQPRCVIDIVCVTRSYPTMIVFFVYSGPSLYHGSLFTASLCRRYCLYHSLLPHCDCLFCVQWSLTIPLFTFHSLAVS